MSRPDETYQELHRVSSKAEERKGSAGHSLMCRYQTRNGLCLDVLSMQGIFRAKLNPCNRYATRVPGQDSEFSLVSDESRVSGVGPL
jgi:hypothetical protein